MKVLVAVIMYNESKNIEKTLNDLQSHNNNLFDIVVIDNGSSDDSVDKVKKMGFPVVAHCVNSGSSMGTVRGYFNYASAMDYDVLCQFDGDGQHLANELSKIINPILNKEADYVIGSRFINKEGFQSYFIRRLGINLFAFLDSMAIGYKVTDVTSGFRAYSKRTINFFAKHYPHELHDTNQLLILAHFSGAKILEVPVLMKPREFGESEYNMMNALVYPFKGIVNILGCLLQKNIVQKYKTVEYGN